MARGKVASAAEATGGTACGRPGDRAISGRTCTIHDDTGCAVKVGLGYAAGSSKRLGLANAGTLEQMAQQLEHDDTVCLSDATSALRTWVAGTLANPAATRQDRRWAKDIGTWASRIPEAPSAPTA